MIPLYLLVFDTTKIEHKQVVETPPNASSKLKDDNISPTVVTMVRPSDIDMSMGISSTMDGDELVLRTSLRPTQGQIVESLHTRPQ